MSTSSYLAGFGITLEQAHDFVLANLGRLDIISSVARQYGVTTEMLGEIAGAPGAPYSAADVRGYFAAHGAGTGDIDAAPLVPSDMVQSTDSLVAFDTSPGTLSVDALRQQVIAQTGAAAYNHAFDPNEYAGGLDGTFSVAETGLASLGDLPADAGTLESIWYGSIVRFGHNLDAAEAAQLIAFMTANQTALQNDDPAANAQAQALLVAAVSTSTDAPYLNDFQVAQAAVTATVELVGSEQGNHQPLFDHVLNGFRSFLS